MSGFDDFSFVPSQFPGKARLLPLPDLVLFPPVIQPIHIFERRYREMLEDALDDDRLIGELPPTRRYREARVEIREDRYPAGEVIATRVLQRRLRDAFLAVLPQLPHAHDQLDQLLATNFSLGTLTDVLAYLLNLPLDQKRYLLAETNVHLRAERLLEHLAEMATRPEPDETGFPPAFSSN